MYATEAAVAASDGPEPFVADALAAGMAIGTTIVLAWDVGKAIFSDDDTPVKADSDSNRVEATDKAEGVDRSSSAGASGGERAGKKHTPAANALGRQLNRDKNDGQLICPACGKKMNAPVQSKKGESVDRDAAVGDHKKAKSKGGDGATVKDMRNHETKCWECNSKKGDR